MLGGRSDSRLSRSLVLLIAAALVAGACGSSGPDSGETSSASIDAADEVESGSTEPSESDAAPATTTPATDAAAPTTTVAEGPRTYELAEVYERGWSRADLVFDGDRFVLPLAVTIRSDRASRASLASADGQTWEWILPDDPSVDPDWRDVAWTRVGDHVVLVPFSVGSADIAWASTDLVSWTMIPVTEPASPPTDVGLYWRQYGAAFDEVQAFMLAHRPDVDSDLIGFKGVVIGCQPPCQDRYASTEGDDRVAVFETDLELGVERLFFAGEDGALEEIAGPDFPVRYLLRTTDDRVLAVARRVLGENRAAFLEDGEWVPTTFEPPSGNTFGMRSHAGRFYALQLQLGNVFELFVSEDDGATWESLATFDEEQVGSFPLTGFAGGEGDAVAIGLAGDPAQLLYAADGRTFEVVAEMPRPEPDVRVEFRDLSFGNALLGYRVRYEGIIQTPDLGFLEL